MARTPVEALDYLTGKVLYRVERFATETENTELQKVLDEEFESFTSYLWGREEDEASE